MPDDHMNQTAGIGHNSGQVYDPQKWEEMKARARDLGKVSVAWGESGVNSREDAEKLNDFITGCANLWKEVDKARAEAKKPFDEKSKEIQKLFKTLLDPLDGMKSKATELLKSFQRRMRAEEQARLDKERAKAEAERKASEEAARKAAEAGDEIEAAEMKAKADAAAKVEKEAAKGPDVKIGSASGSGKTFANRKEVTVTITNPVLLAGFYAKAGNRTVLDALQRAAEADVRAKDVDHAKIPGIKVEVS